MLNNTKTNNILTSKFNHAKTRNNDVKKLNSLYKKNIPKHSFDTKFENNIFKIKDNNIEGLNNITNDNLDIINTIISNNHIKNEININKNLNADNINNITNSFIDNIHKNINNINNNNDDDDDIEIRKNINNILNKKNHTIYIYNLHRKNVKIINNVYQETYAKNVKASGLGDFIRGSYFLLQFCEKYNFQANILINHPISMFLKKFYNTYNLNTDLFHTISSYPSSNWTNSTFDSSNYIVSYNKDNDLIYNFIHYLYTSNMSYNENLYVYNVMFPYNIVSDNHRIYMREIFEPNGEMILYINNVLNTIGYNKYGYSVIHIRSGDKYLNQTTSLFDTDYLKKIINELFTLIQSNMNTKFLLIADNNQIKSCLIKYFPRLRTIFKDISHLGEGTILEKEKVKNTMLDFYLLSYSNSIHSYTCNMHGSGFSHWCAETYNIPYKCKFIQN
jgi:hypothetical protein